eukprot:13167689-Alexandrium_andersonii.AAC.1
MALLTLVAIIWEESKRSAQPQACTECGRRFRHTAARCIICKRGAADCTCGATGPASGGAA